MAAGNVLSGASMTVKYGGTPTVANHAGKWSITKKRATGKFASNSTSGYRQTVQGVKDWSGSMTVFIHDGAALEWSVEGAEVAVQFHVTSGDADYYSGSIAITEVTEEYDADNGEPVAAQITFEGNGTLTANGTIIDV